MSAALAVLRAMQRAKENIQQIDPVLYGITDAEAAKAYDAETSNDPIVHRNRFPGWNELSRIEKNRFKRSMHLKRSGR